MRKVKQIQDYSFNAYFSVTDAGVFKSQEQKSYMTIRMQETMCYSGNGHETGACGWTYLTWQEKELKICWIKRL